MHGTIIVEENVVKIDDENHAQSTYLFLWTKIHKWGVMQEIGNPRGIYISIPANWRKGYSKYIYNLHFFDLIEMASA